METETEVTSLVIAEDHTLFREGTRQLLERMDGFRVIGEAARGDEAVDVVCRLQPDVLLLDMRMPGLNGIEVTRRVLARRPKVRVLVVSAYDDDDYVTEALKAGATGYLLKTAPSWELEQAVEAVHRGESFLSGSISQRLASRWLRSETPGPSQQLSRRELEVLRLVARGRASKEVAAELRISLRTVEGHLNNVFGKLGVASRTEAVYYAINHHLISVEDGGDT
jgi:DNA-binding NarL/FixJ family response regulator